MPKDNKNPTLTLAPALVTLLTNKQTTDQTFHDAESKLILDSQLQNKVTKIEQQVLEGKKVTLPKTAPNSHYGSLPTTHERPYCKA